jgi:hypothetical protein
MVAPTLLTNTHPGRNNIFRLNELQFPIHIFHTQNHPLQLNAHHFAGSKIY